MTLIRPSLDYTDKDFDAIARRLFNVIPTAFPDWTDHQVANFGNLLVEMFAFVGDVLTYYQDNQAQESRWSTALLRRSLLSMTKLIGYRAKGASAATATLTVQLTAPTAGSVTINAGDVFSTDDVTNPISFQATADVTIEAQATPPVASVVVEHSSVVVETYESSGLASQSYTLLQSPFIEGSLIVSDEIGTYTIVDDFLTSSATDSHVTIAVDERAYARVTMGNGVSGRIPYGVLTLRYKIGGGVVGNVDKGKIKRVERSYFDSLGTPVVVRAINVARASGGADMQTTESIREMAPVSLRALTRTVAREDYELNALRVPGVARALMLTSDEQPTILENRGTLYIVPEGGGLATQELLDRVTQQVTVEFPKTITFKPSVRAARYQVINVTARIHMNAGAIGAVVGPAVRKAVAGFFAIQASDGSRNNAIDFGYYLDGELAWSDVFNVVRDTAGVRKIDDGLGALLLNGESDDLQIPLDRFPALGSVTVIDAKTGALL